MKLKVSDFKEAVHRARTLAEEKSGRHENADEFIKIGEADGFRLYVVAGKTINKALSSSLHENPCDVFMLLLEGEMEFTFEDDEKVSARRANALSCQSILSINVFSKR